MAEKTTQELKVEANEAWATLCELRRQTSDAGEEYARAQKAYIERARRGADRYGR